MRIVQALGWYFPESLGGTETYVAALARVLRALGHEVLLTAPDPGATAERTYEFDGSAVFRYPIPSQPTRGEARGDAPVRGTERLHDWLRGAHPDVFHCHSLVTGLGIPEIQFARALGARVLVTFHTPGLGYLCQRGTMMQWGTSICDGVAAPAKCAACALEQRGVSRPLASLLGSIPLAISRRASALPGRVGTGLGMPALIERNVAHERCLLEEADAICVLTEWARRAVEANLGPTAKLHLNRLGIASGHFLQNGSRERRLPLRIGYLGRFDPIKGVLVLAQAVARIPADLEFALEIRGTVRADEEAQFRSLARNDSRVSFAPAVPPESVAAVLVSYDLLICPSIAVEGGPTVALEAHAVGTPVIGSRIGALAEIIEDGVNGQLAPPGDPVALARLIETILRNPGGTIERWRKRLPRPRTMDDVGRDYLRLYETTRHSQK